MQHVGDTAQQLNVRFATHITSMSEKIKSNFCKCLVEHLSTGLCKNNFLVFIDFIDQKDQTFRHGNRKGMSNLNYEQFIINLNNYLRDICLLQ